MFYSESLLTDRRYGVATVWYGFNELLIRRQGFADLLQARCYARLQVYAEEGLTQGDSRRGCEQSMRDHRNSRGATRTTLAE
jgi:hypothetical protein